MSPTISVTPEQNQVFTESVVSHAAVRVRPRSNMSVWPCSNEMIEKPDLVPNFWRGSLNPLPRVRPLSRQNFIDRCVDGDVNDDPLLVPLRINLGASAECSYRLEC